MKQNHDYHQQSNGKSPEISSKMTVYDPSKSQSNGWLTNSKPNGKSSVTMTISEPDTLQLLQEITALQDKLEQVRRPDKEEIQEKLLVVQRFAKQVERYKNLINQELQQQTKGTLAEVSEQQLRSQRYQLATISQQLNRAKDLQSLLQATVTQTQQATGVERVLIYRFESDTQGIVAAEAMSHGWTPTWGETLPATSFGADDKAEYEQEEAVIINDIEGASLTPYQLQLLSKFQVKASLATTVCFEEQAWGLIVLQQCQNPEPWSESQISLLTQISTALSLRLVSFEANSQLEAQLAREKTIGRVIDKIRQSLNLDVIFQTTTQELRKLLKADRVGIYRFNSDWSGKFVAESVASGWMSLVQAQKTDSRIGQDNGMDCSLRDIGTDDKRREKLLSIKDTYLQDTKGGAYRRGDKYRCTNDIYEAGFPPCYIEQLELFQARAYITVPIFLGDKLWGLLATYQNSGPRNWSEEEINLAVQISNQLGIALQQAEYTQELKTQSEQMAQAVQRERTVTRIMERVKQSQDLNTIFEITTKEVRRVFTADRVGIYRFNPDWSGKFVAESVANGWMSLLQAQKSDSRIGQDNGMDCSLRDIGTEDQRREKLLSIKDTYLQNTKGGTYRRGEKYRCTNDIYESGFPPCYVEQLELFQARAYITVPIFLGDKLWGLLATYQNSGPRNWSEEEINLAVQMGSQLGIALQQAEYIQELKSQSEQMAQAVARERAIAKLIDRIKQSQEVDSIFDITTNEVRKIFNADRTGIYRFNPDWSGEFIAESVASGWMSLIQEQKNNPRMQENGMDCSLRDMGNEEQRREKLLSIQDTYLQDTQGGAYRRGDKYRCTNDIYEAGFPPCYIEQLELFQARAYITVPIFLGDKLWGLLATYQNSGPRNWDEQEINLAVQIGSQLGIALQQAEYIQQLQEKSEQLAQLADTEKNAKDLFQKRAIELLTAVRPALDGNLTVRAPITPDALGTIADVYNNTLQSLRQLILQVKQATAQVAAFSSDSEVAVKALSGQAQQQFQELAEALEQVEAMGKSSQAVAQNAEAIGEAVQKANHTVQSGATAMNRTVDGILEIRDSVAEAGLKIRELGESSQKISRVVNTISDFATQTQLLSLNASIEATRAGEYGKGFAVVADEVRSLARKSAIATTDIENLVAEVRSQISEVIKVTEAAISQVQTGTNLVEDTKGSLSAIASATTQIDQLVTDITQATFKQLEQSESVTQTMKNVAEIAANTSENSQDLANYLQESQTTATKLQSAVGQFTVD